MRVLSFLIMALPLLATGCFILDSADGVKGKGGPFPGGDDDDDDDDWAAPLVDGLYEVVDSSVDPMTCGVSTGATLVQFSPVDVAVYSGFVEIVFGDVPLYYEVSGNTLLEESSPYVGSLDFTEPVVFTYFGLSTSFDCVLTEVEDWRGAILDPYSFVLNNVYELDSTSGSQCGAVATSAGFASLPCSDSANTTWQVQ